MKYLSYFFYKSLRENKSLKGYRERKHSAYLNLLAVFGFIAISALAVIDSIFDTHLNIFEAISLDNPVKRRYIYIPLLLSPIYIVIWIVFGSKKMERRVEKFETLTDKEKKKLNRGFIGIIIFTIIFFLIALTSPDWVKWFK